MRPVLIHAHMFKNAGSSFDWSLQRNFGDAFVDHRDDDLMKNGAGYFGSWLQQHHHCQAISSHWITAPLPEVPGLRPLLCLFLRDPVERMRSVYQFERQQQGVDTPGSLRAKKLSFLEYMRWQMEPMPGPVVKNYQTRYCSGTYLGEDLADMFNCACSLISGTDTLGLVHRYDESMVLFEFHLRQYFPQLDLSYVKQNSLSSGLQSHTEKRAQVLEELTEISAEILAANEYDLQLFALAEQRFDQLIARVPDFSTRLAALQERNQCRSQQEVQA
jgi:hypothetical protein